MIIERNGEIIELTDDELTKAYYEQQHKWDMSYVAKDLPNLFNDEGDYDDEIKKLQTDKDFCSKVAYRYRKYLDDYISCDDEWDCWRDAYLYWSKEVAV